MSTTTKRDAVLAALAESQDGIPMRGLKEAADAGRLSSISDNLNRLIADAVNANDYGEDVSELHSDLSYAAEQLQRAADAARAIMRNSYFEK